jgi:hypothetical protein
VTDGGFQVVRIRVDHRERVGSDQPGHHVSATVRAARRRSQCPKAPRNAGSKPSSAHLYAALVTRRALDGAEHSGSIESVMAGRWDG